MKIIRVVVIDDSPFMRKLISDILMCDNRVEVAAVARNGEDGLRKINRYKPDVVTLDVDMPVMDGISALEKMMATTPVPVVMLSGITEEGAAKTFQAMSLGAVDFIVKPSEAGSDITAIKDEIITKVLTASLANVQKKNHDPEMQQVSEDLMYANGHTVVGIGASTGGPRALQRVLDDLPADFPAPVLIAQHMPAGFTHSLARRLNTTAVIHVKEAVHGELIEQHTAYIAPGNCHMQVRTIGTKAVIDLRQEEEQNGHIPSINKLFASLAEAPSINKIAVILTGMGSDGAEGIQVLKKHNSNAVIIAESELTSVVYGMPKAAMKTSLVNRSAPIQQIGKLLADLVNQSTKL